MVDDTAFVCLPVHITLCNKRFTYLLSYLLISFYWPARAYLKNSNTCTVAYNYKRRSEAIASGRQAAAGARGRFWSTDCLLCPTKFSRISRERKKLKNKQNVRNLVYLYSF